MYRTTLYSKFPDTPYLFPDSIHMSAMFADLSKALDSVNQEKVWCKLEAMGAPRYLISNIKAFYKNLSIKVKTAEGLSCAIKITKGVPQVDPLSPLLFILYLSDLPTHLNNNWGITALNKFFHILIFADDIAILATSSSIHN